MNFNIDNEIKREILLKARLRHEENLYTSLCNIGIDPDTFNAGAFVATEGDLAEEEVVSNAEKLAVINQKLAGLD